MAFKIGKEAAFPFSFAINEGETRIQNCSRRHNSTHPQKQNNHIP
jgi:hypothetical protein